MPYEFLKLEVDGGIGVLTLNRPETFNSWNQKMRDEMRDAVRELVGDDALRVLVITGTGRAFSAGERSYSMSFVGAPVRPGNNTPTTRQGCEERRITASTKATFNRSVLTISGKK